MLEHGWHQLTKTTIRTRLCRRSLQQRQSFSGCRVGCAATTTRRYFSKRRRQLQSSRHVSHDFSSSLVVVSVPSLSLMWCTATCRRPRPRPPHSQLAARLFTSSSAVSLTSKQQPPPTVTVTLNRHDDHTDDSDTINGAEPKGHGRIAKTTTTTNRPATMLVDQLLSTTRQLVYQTPPPLLDDGNDTLSMNATSSTMDNNNRAIQTHHVVAFSGGVDSSLVAALLHKIINEEFTTSKRHDHHHLTAVLGISPAVPKHQSQLAQEVATHIGMSLQQVQTGEGTDKEYIRNAGQACLVCKTYLYSTLQSIVSHYQNDNDNNNNTSPRLQLYNGTNADDLQDPTRVGLLAANNFQVRSPLSNISKDQVRLAARHLGLPNWNYAASPCLRSRIAWGVPATQQHLHFIETCEDHVRQTLVLDVTINMRVRLLAKNQICIEVDQNVLDHASTIDWENEACFVAAKEQLAMEAASSRIHNEPSVTLRAFHTGSVAKHTGSSSNKTLVTALSV